MTPESNQAKAPFSALPPSETKTVESSYNDSYAPTNDAVDSLGDALAGVNIGFNSSSHECFAIDRGCSNGIPHDARNGIDSRLWGGDMPRDSPSMLSPSRHDTRLPSYSPVSQGSTNHPLSGRGFIPVRETVGRPSSEERVGLFSHTPSLGHEMLRLGHEDGVIAKTSPHPSTGTLNSTETSYERNVAYDKVLRHEGLSPAREVYRPSGSPSCSVTGTTLSSSGSPSPTHHSDYEARRTIPAYHRGHDPHKSSSYALAQAEPSPSALFGNLPSTHAQDLDQFGAGGYGNHTSSTLKVANVVLERSYLHQTVDNNVSLHRLHVGNKQDAVRQGAPASDQQLFVMAVSGPEGYEQSIIQPIQTDQSTARVLSTGTSGAALYSYNTTATSRPSAGTRVQEYVQPLVYVPTIGYQGRVENHQEEHFYEPQVHASLPRDGGGVSRNKADSYALERTPSSSTPESSRDAVAALYAAPCRPPIDALLGHFSRLSRDQLGCRLLQQALDEEGPTCATLVLNKGLPYWADAMIDPFGNYLFQKMLEKITPEERVMLVKNVSPRLVNASMNLHGTRSVQKLIELCAADEVVAASRGGGGFSHDVSSVGMIERSLAPAAARLCIDSHGNHVIQRVLLNFDHQHARFVFAAVAKSVGDIARHRHGCCVIQRCLDSSPSRARLHLAHRIVGKTLDLMQDAYGNYVIQYVLDVCSDDHVHAVCESVVGKVNLLAIQKFSSNVMEKCLERCSERVKELYIQELSDPIRICELMTDPFGNYVIQRALQVATHDQAVRLVEAMRPHLLALGPRTCYGHCAGGIRNTAGGRRIMAKICKRFPNFTLNAVGSFEQSNGQHKRIGRQLQPTSPPPLVAFSVSQPQTRREHRELGSGDLSGSHNQMWTGNWNSGKF